MNIEIYIESKRNAYYAKAIYYGEKVVVKKGGQISQDFSNSIRGGNNSRRYREDRSFVDENGRIIKDCEFSSLSTAAQFVSGRSISGYTAWKVEKGKAIGKYLQEKGLR
ncbi:DUF4357 domain-containing protein [Butyrivibrio fibrisolvens]|uniref:DUF4357 domain-containing protein n=1 Tax=Butyrivibrio fibrisolvens TaxID=831 RepID=UPI000552FA4B|nr:DUF4357 domain-containing protein [Butyrivibrio fibrisolvens]